jgi:hypothetical protein
MAWAWSLLADEAMAAASKAHPWLAPLARRVAATAAAEIWQFAQAAR